MSYPLFLPTYYERLPHFNLSGAGGGRSPRGFCYQISANTRQTLMFHQFSTYLSASGFGERNTTPSAAVTQRVRSCQQLLLCATLKNVTRFLLALCSYNQAIESSSGPSRTYVQWKRWDSNPHKITLLATQVLSQLSYAPIFNFKKASDKVRYHSPLPPVPLDHNRLGLRLRNSEEHCVILL